MCRLCVHSGDALLPAGNSVGAATLLKGSSMREREPSSISTGLSAGRICKLDGSFRRVNEQHVLFQHGHPGNEGSILLQDM